MTAEIRSDVITATERIKAPPEVVFPYFTDPALPPGGSTVEVVLTPDGDDTIVVLTHRRLGPADIGTHRAGWEHRLGLLRLAAG